MSNLSVYSSGGGLSAQNSVNVGEGVATNDLTFSGRPEMYEDLPVYFRQGASRSTEMVLAKEKKERQPGTSVVLASEKNITNPTVVPPDVLNKSFASGVRKLSKSFKNGDRIVQRKIGWLATPELIYVTTVERELQWRPDKKLAPKTDWLIENRRKFVSVKGLAEKRVGIVTENFNTNQKNRDVVFVEAKENIPDAFVNGAETMSFLPVSVRGDIVSQVPRPTFFDGRLLGSVDNNGVVQSYEISLLRMDDNIALVIQATKKVDSDQWQVTEAKYFLDTPVVESF